MDIILDMMQSKIGINHISFLLLFISTLLGCSSRENQLEASKTLGQSSEEHNNLPDLSYLFDRNIIGKFSTGKNEWYLVSGRLCQNCDENVAIYLAAKNEILGYDSLKLQNYSYPGRLYSFDEELLFEARVLYGDCLNASKKTIIWIQREKNNETWVESTFIVELTDTSLVKRFTRFDSKELEKKIRSGLCFELAGRDITSEP